MNKELLNTIVEKYKSGYYHNNSIYEYRPEVRKDFYVFNCDHIELVYNLMECDIKEEDCDFIYNNSLDRGTNDINFMKYIIEIEKQGDIKKAIINLAWYFDYRDKRWIHIYGLYKEYENIFNIKGKTLVEHNIRGYKAEQGFRNTCAFFDTAMKVMDDMYNENKQKKEEAN